MDSPSPAGSPAAAHDAPSSPTQLLGSSSSDSMPAGTESAQFKNALTRELFGRKMTVITWQSKQYLIGVQIAHYLKRETFNLYRSMKLANIDIIKCQPQEIEELTQLDAIKRGIHSVTLVPYDQGVMYISKELKRKPRKKSEKRARDEKVIVASSPPLRRLAVSSSSDDVSPAEDESSQALRSGAAAATADADHCSESSEHESQQRARPLAYQQPAELRRQHWAKLLMIATAERLRLLEEGIVSQ